MWLPSDLDQRSPRGRALGPAAAIGAAGFRPARRGALARARPLLRLGRHRTFDEFEADLVLAFCGLVLDQHDADVTAALELAEQHLVGQGLLDVLLDHAGHWPGAHLLVVTTFDQ